MVLKRCTISLLSRHLGLEESKITGHSNKREKIARLSRRVPKGSKLKTRITNAWSQEEIDIVLTLSRGWWQTSPEDWKEEKDYRILKPNFHLRLFCGKRKKLRDSQTRRVSAYVPDMVWKKWNRRAENGIKCCFIFSREVKKLNYRVLKNTDRTQSLWWFGRKSNCNDMVLKQAIGSERFGRE